MGTYHTFFVAKDEDLDRLFPGWKRVKPQKVAKEALNPFTKQKMTVETWEPVEPPAPLGKPSLYDDAWGPPLPPIVAVENEYMEEIEQAGAPGLRALPHFRGKNYDPFLLLEPLAGALAGEDVPVPPARVGRDGDDDAPSVDALPDVAVKNLATIDDGELPAIMDKVLAAGGASAPQWRSQRESTGVYESEAEWTKSTEPDEYRQRQMTDDWWSLRSTMAIPEGIEPSLPA